MAEKYLFAPKYWATKAPNKREKIMIEYHAVKDRAGIQGKKIGLLGTGAHVIVDLNEDAGGDWRIVSVVDCITPPVPESWIEAQKERTEKDREWWVDKGSLIDADADPTKFILRVEWDNATGTGKVSRIS